MVADRALRLPRREDTERRELGDKSRRHWSGALSPDADCRSDAETMQPELAGQPLLAEGEPSGQPAGEELPPELQAPDPSERHGRFRHGRRGREERERGPRFEGGGGGGGGGGDRPPQREPQYERPASSGGRTPIPDLSRLPPRGPSRPAFLGTGTFGRWGNSGD